VGPLEPLPDPVDRSEGSMLYGYFDSRYHQNKLLCRELFNIKDQVEVYFKQDTNEEIQQLKNHNVQILDYPISFTQDISKYSVIMSNATLNTCQAALAAGIPQITFPINLESGLTATLLDNLGVSKQVINIKPNSLKETINLLANDKSLKQRALNIAQRIHSRDKETIFERTMAGCEALL
jgi:UDP:flavonoid glycosyltransferase YjiC (YdhE family)